MHGFVTRLAKLFAILGGVTLSFLIVLTCASVLGRSINSILNSDLLQEYVPSLAALLLSTGVGPINGDFEIVEAGMAFAIFAFIPICQLTGSHASVEVFTSTLSARFNAVLRTVIEVVFAAVLVVFAWQLMQGGLRIYGNGTTTLLLEFPVWWSYAASSVAAWVAAFVGVYVAVIRLAGRAEMLDDEGANH